LAKASAVPKKKTGASSHMSHAVSLFNPASVKPQPDFCITSCGVQSRFKTLVKNEDRVIGIFVGRHMFVFVRADMKWIKPAQQPDALSQLKFRPQMNR
jgi:hypothetical protein